MTDPVDEFDIYGDLDSPAIIPDSAEIEKLKEQLADTTAKFNETKIHINKLEEKNSILKQNISSLLLTARSELERRDKQINEIRREKEDICFRRTKLTKPIVNTVVKRDKYTQTDPVVEVSKFVEHGQFRSDQTHRYNGYRKDIKSDTESRRSLERARLKDDKRVYSDRNSRSSNHRLRNNVYHDRKLEDNKMETRKRRRNDEESRSSERSERRRSYSRISIKADLSKTKKSPKEKGNVGSPSRKDRTPSKKSSKSDKESRKSSKYSDLRDVLNNNDNDTKKDIKLTKDEILLDQLPKSEEIEKKEIGSQVVCLESTSRNNFQTIAIDENKPIKDEVKTPEPDVNNTIEEPLFLKAEESVLNNNSDTLDTESMPLSFANRILSELEHQSIIALQEISMGEFKTNNEITIGKSGKESTTTHSLELGEISNFNFANSLQEDKLSIEKSPVKNPQNVLTYSLQEKIESSSDVILPEHTVEKFPNSDIQHIISDTPEEKADTCLDLKSPENSKSMQIKEYRIEVVNKNEINVFISRNRKIKSNKKKK